MKNLILVLFFFVLAICAANSETTDANWKTIFDSRLPEYGHRNWIVVADAAYPKQSAPGIETIFTGEDHLQVLKYVVGQIKKANHVRPITMLDEELGFVTESAAPGVNKLRSDLNELFGDQEILVMPHEDIIAKLDKGSELFNVLLLKTNLTIPYTSVFLELDCGYWDEKSEIELREKFNLRDK